MFRTIIGYKPVPLQELETFTLARQKGMPFFASYHHIDLSTQVKVDATAKTEGKYRDNL